VDPPLLQLIPSPSPTPGPEEEVAENDLILLMDLLPLFTINHFLF